MRWQLTLARQLLLFQLGIVLLVVAAVAAVSLAGSAAAFRREEGARLRSIAANLAANDTVRRGVGDPVWQEPLAGVAETARSVSGSSFVVLTDAGGILVTGPDRGRPAPLGDSDGLAGKGWLGVVGDGSRSLVAHEPILDPADAHVLGLVIAGKTYPSWPELIAAATPDLLTYLLLGSVLGVSGSLLLARRVKRQTLGLEPREIAGLVEHREAMLHGIKEGLVGLDTAGRVTLANDEAVRLLGLPPDTTGRPLREIVSEPLAELLTGAVDEPDAVVVQDARVLVLNRMPVVVRGTAVGSVTTLRDQTELSSLEHELALSRTATDTLRAQAHEFTNRLHTISGLLQLGQYEEAVNFIISAGEAQEALSNDVQSRIADPALAALIIAKASVAAEQQVLLVVRADSGIPGPLDDRLAADLVTVTGNLVDNAIDAVSPGGRVEVSVRRDAADVVVTVHDSGPGVSSELAEKVFRSGYTTKAGDGHRGLGLALVSTVCAARRGSVSVTGPTFTARLPLRAVS
ncbi:sensor histidine kinase [Asanoa iriomotensis]|uniref:histidine kinase n=1 Tax=Asanoa iriomotensis TaxID=234613 RepID=A0ABQ4CCQ2_9ACTN|nr:ATP-binding protein [Asanoa iriomotensis]GIF60547.1 ATPase [Asanoa iriomotensis]